MARAKLTFETKQAICAAIKSGQLSVAEAAAQYGCATSTIYTCLQNYDLASYPSCPEHSEAGALAPQATAALEKPSASSYLPPSLNVYQALILIGKLEVWGYESEQALLECQKLGVDIAALHQFAQAAESEGLVDAHNFKVLNYKLEEQHKHIDQLKLSNERLQQELTAKSELLLQEAQILKIKGRLVSASERAQIIDLIGHCADQTQWSIKKVCTKLGFCERKYYHYLNKPIDGRLTCPRAKNKRALSETQKDAIVARYQAADVKDLSLREAYYCLLCADEYLCSLSSVQRIFRERGLARLNNSSKIVLRWKDTADKYPSLAPGQVIYIDATAFKVSRSGGNVYCLVAMDAASRYIIAAQLYHKHSQEILLRFLTLLNTRLKTLLGTNNKGTCACYFSPDLEVYLSELNQYGDYWSFNLVGSNSKIVLLGSNLSSLSQAFGCNVCFKSLDECARAIYYAVVKHNSRPHSYLNDLTAQACFSGTEYLELDKRKLALAKSYQENPERFVLAPKHLRH